MEILQPVWPLFQGLNPFIVKNLILISSLSSCACESGSSLSAPCC